MDKSLIHTPDRPIRDPGQQHGLSDETLKGQQTKYPGELYDDDRVLVRKVDRETRIGIEPPPGLRAGADHKIQDRLRVLQEEIGDASIVVVIIQGITTAVIDHIDQTYQGATDQFDDQTGNIIAITRIGFDIFDPPAVGDEKDNHQQQRWNDQVDNRQVLNHGLRI